VGVAVALSATFGAQASSVKRGGTLNLVVGSKIPSFDGHAESTFGMIHPIRPFYSLLLRVDPNNPSSPTAFQCDVCEEIPKPTNGGKRYTFKIKKNVTFHDGQKMTAQDVLATHNKIIFPQKGVPSVRKGFYGMVEKISAPDDYTIVFDLKYPSPGFLPALATPYNFVYSKADLEKHGMSWHKKNINGTGAFKFVQHQPGAFVEGKRREGYHHMGADGKALPYLDGYKAISAPKMAIRVQAIRGNRAAIEFRGFPPKTRDDLVKSLGDKITVQEGDWNCVMGASTNVTDSADGGPAFHAAAKDTRVRQALTLAMDRYGGSKYLSKIALVKSPGGVVFPSHPLAATKSELAKMPSYNPDNETRWGMAKKLLADAGQTDLKFTLHNRAVDQPYKIVGTWMIDQWKKVGLEVDQAVLPSGPWYDGLRKKRNYQVGIDFNCQGVVNPVVDASKFISKDKSGNQYGGYIDRQLDDWYTAMNRESDPEKQAAIMRKFEKYVLWDKSYFMINYWWYKINPHRSYVKGWKQAPSHYLNQHLDQVWLDK